MTFAPRGFGIPGDIIPLGVGLYNYPLLSHFLMLSYLLFDPLFLIYIYIYVMYKPWPRGVYVRYTPAVRNLLVIFPEGQRPEGYITNKLPNIAGVYLKIYTDWTWFIRYILC